MDHAEEYFKNSLKKSGLKEISSPEGCHFILFFCPITSRAGTDIDAAVKYLNEVNKASKPVIMVVLHHTFDPEKMIRDSNIAITTEEISAVDCLFDDEGLLACQKNRNAISKIQTDSKSKKWTSYYCLKKNLGNTCLSTNQDPEVRPLLHNQGSVHEPNSEVRGSEEHHGCLQALCFRLKHIFCCLCCCSEH